MFCGDTSRWTSTEQLAVQAAQFVRGVQASAGVREDAKGDAGREPEPPLLDGASEPGERVPLHPLDHDVEHVVLLAHIENLRDVHVLDTRGDTGLVEQRLLEVVVGREVRQDRLDGDELLEAMFALDPGQPHARHPPLGDGAQQLVAIEP